MGMTWSCFWVDVIANAGWIAFWWVVWLVVKKFIEISQGSLALKASTF